MGVESVPVQEALSNADILEVFYNLIIIEYSCQLWNPR